MKPSYCFLGFVSLLLTNCHKKINVSPPALALQDSADKQNSQKAAVYRIRAAELGIGVEEDIYYLRADSVNIVYTSFGIYAIYPDKQVVYQAPTNLMRSGEQSVENLRTVGEQRGRSPLGRYHPHVPRHALRAQDPPRTRGTTQPV